MCRRRDSECVSGEVVEICSQVVRWQPDRAPAARPMGSHMHAIARTEGHEFAFPGSDCTPDRREPTADRKCHQDRLCRYRKEANQRQVLFHSRQAQVMQLDLRHPCLESAICRDKQAEVALIAQGSLEIVRPIKYRRHTTRHSYHHDAGGRAGQPDRTAGIQRSPSAASRTHDGP
jgi:hypothetical protein